MPYSYLIGNTALHQCVIYKKRDPIRPLLKAGARLNCVDIKGNTVLHLAAERNEIEYIKRIVNYHLCDVADQATAVGMFDTLSHFIIHYSA